MLSDTGWGCWGVESEQELDWMLLMGSFQLIIFHDLPAESYSESVIKEK